MGRRVDARPTAAELEGISNTEEGDEECQVKQQGVPAAPRPQHIFCVVLFSIVYSKDRVRHSSADVLKARPVGALADGKFMAVYL